jgi:hypothetical protein
MVIARDDGDYDAHWISEQLITIGHGRCRRVPFTGFPEG